MIRINLLGVERKQTRSSSKAPTFDIGQKLTVACSMILVVAVLGIGYWYWSLSEASARVDREIAAANAEATRLRSLLTEVQQFEGRRGQLTQRVQLIEQLRGGQSVPVQLLDHVSRSLPDMLWLTEMEQTSDALTIQGRAMTLLAVSDFVRDLGVSDLLVKPIDIPNTQVESLPGAQGQPPIDVIRFTVRAGLKPRVTAPVPAAGAARGAGAGD